MLDANEYRQLSRVHGELIKLAGTPPFTVRLGEESDDALSFEDLRRKVMEVAGKGVKMQRFKGPGRDERGAAAETTMDPETRTLAQVTMDDAAVADRLFTMLMATRSSRAASSSRRTPASRPWTSDGASRSHLRRQHRAPRARGGDALVVSRTTRCRSSSGARCPTSATA
jgi:hypothetical protein